MKEKFVLPSACVCSFSQHHLLENFSNVYSLLFVENKLAVGVRVHISILCSVLLIYVSFYSQMILFRVTKGVWREFCLKSRILILLAFVLFIHLLGYLVLPYELYNCSFWFCEECD